MRMRTALLPAAVLAFVFASGARADVTRNVPVVTQIQGATFYRTSITLTNGNETLTVPVVMDFSYRSPADGTFQIATLTLSTALGRSAWPSSTTSSRVQNAGRIRAADTSQALRNAMGVRRLGHQAGRRRGADLQRDAGRRTGSPSMANLLRGRIAIPRSRRRPGRCFRQRREHAPAGIVSDGSASGVGATDVRITYFDRSTGTQLKQFFLSDLIHPISRKARLLRSTTSSTIRQSGDHDHPHGGRGTERGLLRHRISCSRQHDAGRLVLLPPK
jgi:hypothetical protein